jgi:peptidylprolyl isomerase
MKQTFLPLFLAATSVAAFAQTPPAPATTPHKAATTASTASKLPPNVPVVHGIVKTAFSLRYEDYKVGTGAEFVPGKLLKVQYTGYRASDGVKFDSSFDHPGVPVMGPDNKPVMGPDGKPKLGPPQPMSFPQGMGRLIPGFDQGFYGMKVGGKRRIFIPWQLAYGTHEMPGRGAEHPGIPAKSDLIFDVELVEMTDAPTPPARPGMGGRPMPPHPGGPGAPGTPTPGKPATPGAPSSGTAPAPGAAPAPAPGAPPTTPPPSTSTPAPSAPSNSVPATPVPVTPPPASAPAPAAPPPATPPSH